MSMPVDIVCLSHLRWNFVYQRPNHLMARAAQTHRVFFVEEPERVGTAPRIDVAERDGVNIVRPILPAQLPANAESLLLRDMLDSFLAEEGVRLPWLWYYTPMALPWTSHIQADAVIYDCMDELSGFKFAPVRISMLERELIGRSDVVFAGGRSLYEAKRGHHPQTHLFPSSVDVDHFGQARRALPEPSDQASIGRPRIGYFGVIDERIDLDLVRDAALARPDWNFVMVGPVTKVNEDDLPRAANIHWLGIKTYAELPAYLSGWDVAIMPFALNASTRHISPTKTPEYLVGGRPVVSTAIHDVVHPYGDQGLVHIAADSAGFVAAIDRALQCDREELMGRADQFLSGQSWDATWAAMSRLVLESRAPKSLRPVMDPVDLGNPTSAASGGNPAHRVAVGMSSAGGAGARPR